MAGKYDWEAIEREYRAGQLSVREIASRYGVNASTISRRAKRYGWERDLSERVRDRAHAKSMLGGESGDDEAVVEAAADRGAQVLDTQRQDIREMRAQGQALLAELQQSDLDLPRKAGTYRDLVQGMARLVPLERQAFNLDDNAGRGDDPLKSFMRKVSGETFGLPSERGDVPEE